MTDDARRLLRQQRCRLAGLQSSIAFVVGSVAALAGWNFVVLGTGDVGYYLAGLGAVFTAVGFTGIAALFGHGWAQRLIDRLGGDSDSVWNEPWYDDVSPYGSLSMRQRVVETDGGDES